MLFLYTLWMLICEMAPYLLFGFLVAGMLHTFVPQSVYQRHLGRPGFRSVLNATLLGVPLPLCSCGVIPTTVALRRAGASRGACTAFLIATPQTGVDSILATYSLLGLPFAIIRPVAALVTGLVGGWVTDATTSPLPCHAGERGLSASSTGDDCEASLDKSDNTAPTPVRKGWGEALSYGFGELLEDVGRWLAMGLIIAALITVFVPNDFFVVLQDYPLVNMLIVLAVAIPMYLCATGSIPIALSLLMKGLTPGAALVMLMAGPAVNAASLLVVGKALGRRQMMAYIASIICGAIVFGLLIDYVLPSEWFVPTAVVVDPCCSAKVMPWYTVALSVLFLVLLVRALYARQFGHHHHDCDDACCDQSSNVNSDCTTYEVTGMRCSHCAANCQQAIKAVEGVESVDVDLSTGRVTVSGNYDSASLISAIHNAGYSVKTNT